MSKIQPWDIKGSLSVETAILDGLFEGATDVEPYPDWAGKMRLVYGERKGQAGLDGADIGLVRDFIYDAAALHDRRINLGNWVDDNRMRTSTLNVEPDGKAHTLDITIRGKRVARLWIEQNIELIAMTGEEQVEIYVEPVDGSRTSVQYNDGPRMARDPMRLVTPVAETILALTLPKEEPDAE